jgi:hypothetical protein
MNAGILSFFTFGAIGLAAGGPAASEAAPPIAELPPVVVESPQPLPSIAESLRRLPPTGVTWEATALFYQPVGVPTEAGGFPGALVSGVCERISDADTEPGVAPDELTEPPAFEPLPNDFLLDDDGELIQIGPDPVDPWSNDPFGRYSYRGLGSPPDASHWIPGSGDRMGILTFVFNGIPAPKEGKNSWGLAANWHLVSGPRRTDMPSQLWDFTAHFGRRNRLDSYWSYDIALHPGWFSDFDGSAREGFRVPGHGVLYYTPSDEFQLLVGIDCLDRDDIALLPVVGAVFKPHPDFRLDAVFPRPRVAARLDGKRWLYLAAEMGGGTWAIQRADWTNDVATYRDYRLCLGVQQCEEKGEEGTTYLEVGYVFARHLEYRSGTPSYDPLSTTLLRIVTCY